MTAAEHTRPVSGGLASAIGTRVLRRAALYCIRNRVFFALLASVAAVRLAILLIAQNHVHSDEAIIGLMAKHILEKGAWPVYFYGQPFNGGAALEAYLAAPLFLLFGAGVKPLKLTIVLLSLCSWSLFYFLVRRFWSDQIAWKAALLFAVAPTLLPWHFQVRGGYGEYHLFMLAILYATLSLAENEARPSSAFLLFGFVSGIALWCFELILPFILLCLVYLAVIKRKIFYDRRIFLTAAAALAGYLPALHYNLTHQAANWWYIVQQKLESGKGFSALLDPETWHMILTFELPRFFGPETVLWYKPEVSASGIVFYALALAAVAHALWHHRRRHIGFIARGLQKEQAGSAAFRETLLLFLMLSCLLPYAVVAVRVPGYLIGVVPLISILAAIFIDTLICYNRKSIRAVGILVLLTPIAFGIFDYAKFLHTDHIESLKLTAQGRLAPTTFSGRGLSQMIAHLQQRGIPAVLSSPSLQYPIIFESNETILASSAPLPFRYIVYPAYDRGVAEAISAKPVFVIEADSPLRNMAFSIIRQMTPGRVSVTEFDGIVIFEGEAR